MDRIWQHRPECKHQKRVAATKYDTSIQVFLNLDLTEKATHDVADHDIADVIAILQSTMHTNLEQLRTLRRLVITGPLTGSGLSSGAASAS